MTYPQDPYQQGGQQPYGQQPPGQPYGQDPYGQPGYGGYDAYGYPAPAGGYGYGYAQPVGTNGMAIGSLVTSLVGLVVCFGILGIVGAILGHVALGQIRDTGQQGRGLALGGIIVGWISFALIIGIVIIALTSNGT